MLALWAARNRSAAVMINGRNITAPNEGFETIAPCGEMQPSCASRWFERTVGLPPHLYDHLGHLLTSYDPPPPVLDAVTLYRDRYCSSKSNQQEHFIRPHLLRGVRLGVLTDGSALPLLQAEVYAELGAEVSRIAAPQLRSWCAAPGPRSRDLCSLTGEGMTANLDAVLGTNPLNDAPLFFDEHGRLVKGDITAILTAKWLKARTVAAPSVCNSSLLTALGDAAQIYHQPVRVDAYLPELLHGAEAAVAFDADGRFFLCSDIERNGRVLERFAYSDPTIVHLGTLAMCRKEEKPLSALVGTICRRFTEHGSVTGFPNPAELLEKLARKGLGDRNFLEQSLTFRGLEAVSTPGMYIRFGSSTDTKVFLHHPAGTTRIECYIEADAPEKAEHRLTQALRVIEGWRNAPPW